MYVPRGCAEAKCLLDKALEDNTPILVYFDPDVDGLIAGYFVCKYLSTRGIPYEYYLNENRTHGFHIDVEKVKGYLVILVDAAIEDMESIVNTGVKIINIDHHEIPDEELRVFTSDSGELLAVTINNQYCFEPEEQKFQSGAGMVYHVLNYFTKGVDGDEELCSFNTEENIALVGITLISDDREIENTLARNFLKVTYVSRAPYIKYLIDSTCAQKDFGFGVVCMDMNYISYTLAPRLNALLRLNLGNEALDFMLNGKGSNVDFTFLRNKQNEIIDIMLKNLKIVESSHLVVGFLDYDAFKYLEDGFLLSNFIGVVASRVLTQHGKTTFLFLRDGNTLSRGSVRGKKDGIDYRGIFSDNGVDCKGHKGACGVRSIKGNDLRNLDLQAISEAIKDIEEKTDVLENRVIEVKNLNLWATLDNKAVALNNIYSRDAYKIFLKYTGKNWEKQKRGKMYEFVIDGIKVKCFQDTLSPENAYIMPSIERGYILYYMKAIEK